MTETMTENSHIESIEAGLARLDAPIVEQTAQFPNAAAGAVRRSFDLREGSRFLVRGCTRPQWWPDRCHLAEGEARGEKRMTQHWEETEFIPFKLVDVLAADCYDPEFDLQTLTDDQVSNASMWAVAQELDWGPSTRVNPTLQNSAIPVNTNPANPVDAVAMLWEAIGTYGPLQPSLWSPYRAAPALDQYITRPGGRWRAFGAPISFGTTGNGPTTAADGSPLGTPETVDGDGVWTPATNPAPPGTAWIYATSTVEYDLGTLEAYDPSGLTRSERQNMAVAETLGRGLVRFNPLCTFAALVCLKQPNLCAPVVEVEQPPTEG